MYRNYFFIFSMCLLNLMTHAMPMGTRGDEHRDDAMRLAADALCDLSTLVSKVRELPRGKISKAKRQKKCENTLPDRFCMGVPQLQEPVASVFASLLSEPNGIGMNMNLDAEYVECFTEEVEWFGMPNSVNLRPLHDVGYGVFATSHLPAHTIIGIYSGQFRFLSLSRPPLKMSEYAFSIHSPVLLDEDEFVSLQKGGYIFSNAQGYDPDEEFEIVVNADMEGNWLRFINHDETPNAFAEYRKIVVKGVGEMLLPVIVTARNIDVDEQLFLDYGPAYWEKLKKVPQALKRTWAE